MSEDARNPHPVSGSGRAIFTVDLEEYFQVDALREWAPETEWDSLPKRAGWVLDRLLESLDRHGARATFFVSDWLLRARPELARRVVDAGHETAVLARPPTEGDVDVCRAAFRRTAREARDRLGRVTGRPVLGYRTAGFRHPLPAEQAAEDLAELGFRYDSTVVRAPPARDEESAGGPEAGDAGAGRYDLLEIPPTTCSLGGERLFTAGGPAFRLLPEAVTHRLLRRAASRRHAGVFYMRVWEFDPEQPVLPVPPLARTRLYWGVDEVEDRLARLLEAFDFDSVGGALGLDGRTATLHTAAGEGTGGAPGTSELERPSRRGGHS